MHRTLGRVGMAVTIGLAVVAVALLPPPSSTRSLPAALSPAPREDCPFGIGQPTAIPVEEYADRSHGQLPTWLPEGFGFVLGFASTDGTYGYGSSGG